MVVESIEGDLVVKKRLIRLLCCAFGVMFLFMNPLHVVAAEDVFVGTESENAGESSDATEITMPAISGIEAPSYILMEASTGQVICEYNADEKRSPASITKIMTLLLIFEHLDRGKIKLESDVLTSAYAQSMGGSQVFLEEGEVQSLETIIKCIAVASGNDASVAAAEFIAGSEQEFVKMMNEKAKELGLTNTRFEDCCGLSESDGHYSSAGDVAIMSRELITKYPQVLQYTGIWMEDIVHSTARGDSVFTLTSTNKLLKMYEHTTGLKTGSTGKAKYCLSATASKDGIDLIAVVMGSPNNKVRFRDAMTLLNYGYSVSTLYEDKNEDALPKLPIKGGIQEDVRLVYKEPFRYLDTEGRDFENIKKTIRLPEEIEAPLKRGEAVGEAVYLLNDKRIGSISIVSDENVEKAGYFDYLGKVFKVFCSLG